MAPLFAVPERGSDSSPQATSSGMAKAISIEGVRMELLAASTETIVVSSPR
jgi:hypothetical protein